MNVDESINLKEVEEKKRKVLERLNARHTKKISSSKSPSHTLVGPEKVEDLQAEAKALLADPNAEIDISFLEKIESALSLLPLGFESRCLRDLHAKLRIRLQKKSSEVSVFSFKSKQQSPIPSPTTDLDTITSLAEVTVGIARSKNSRTVSEVINKTLEVEGFDGEDVAIMNVTDSKLAVKFNASTIHLKAVENSTLVLAPVQSSVMIRDCANLTLVVAAQQIRIHNSHNMLLHIAVRGAIIIEDCDKIQVAPYRIKDVKLDWSNDNWKVVKDFNWLAINRESPNWSVMNEDSWKTFDFNFS